jgi:hypothetical protein
MQKGPNNRIRNIISEFLEQVVAECQNEEKLLLIRSPFEHYLKNVIQPYFILFIIITLIGILLSITNGYMLYSILRKGSYQDW